VKFTKKNNSFLVDWSNLIKLGLNVVLIKVTIINIFRSKPFLFQNGNHLKILTQNISETGSFIKFIHGRHFETEKDFDLKFFMLMYRNKNI
jgi:hypothetical protein